MKILFVSEYFYPKIMGGGELNLLQRCKELVKQGHMVVVLTSYFDGLKEYDKKDGIEIYRSLKTGKYPTSIISNLKRAFVFPKTILNEIKKFEYEKLYLMGRSIIVSPYINCFAIVENLMSVCPKSDRLYNNKKECPYRCTFTKFIKCQLRSKYLGKMENKVYLKYNPLFLLFVWRNYKQMNNALKYCKIITVSKYMQKLLIMLGYKSTIEPNFIDKKMFSKTPVKRKKNKERIVCLGSLVEYRGFHILLKAAKGLNCRIEIYGEGVMKKHLQKLIDKNNLDAEIFSPIPYKKVPKVYSKADIVVVPSVLPEPEGRVAKEAQMMGKKIIVANVGALADIKDALKFKHNNVGSLRKILKNELKEM